MEFCSILENDPKPSMPEPRKGRIAKEPLVAVKDGHLVIVIDHVFEDIPSWIEWDAEREMLTITQMGGQMDETHVHIEQDAYESLRRMRKLLLISNDNAQKTEEKIVHYIAFLPRD